MRKFVIKDNKNAVQLFLAMAVGGSKKYNELFEIFNELALAKETYQVYLDLANSKDDKSLNDRIMLMKNLIDHGYVIGKKILVDLN